MQCRGCHACKHPSTQRAHPADYDLETPWYTVFIASREAEDAAAFYIPNPVRQTEVPIGLLSGIFLLLSGIDHLFTVLPGVNKRYNRGLQRNENPYRWLEYSRARTINPFRSLCTRRAPLRTHRGRAVRISCSMVCACAVWK